MPHADEPPAPWHWVPFWIYLYLVGRILFLGILDYSIWQALVTPSLLGRTLEFWISACNFLWMLLFFLRLRLLVASGRRAPKSELILLLLALAGLAVVEAGLPAVFTVLEEGSRAQ